MLRAAPARPPQPAPVCMPRRRPPSRRARAAALALLCAGAIGLAACGGGSAHHGAASVRREAPLISLFTFGGGGQLQDDPAGTLDRLRALGVSMVKLYMRWSAVAPDPLAARAPAGFDATDPGAYPAAGWAVYDAVVRAARARGIAIDLTVGGPAPLWASTPGAPGGPPGVWKPLGRDYGAFLRAVGRRYGGAYRPTGAGSPLPRVSFWALWNEPNYGVYLAPQAVDHSTVEVAPAVYRSLVDAGWSALHASGHGGDTILIGELAPRGLTFGNNPGNFSGMVPLRFVRALYCVDASLRPLRGGAATVRGCPATAAGSAAFARSHPGLFHASGFAVHPYPQGNVPPTQRTAFEPDYADFASLPRLESTLDTIQSRYGSATRFPIYSTEYGYQTDPPEHIAHAAPVQMVAIYLNQAEYLSWRDPRIRSYDQYLLEDPPGANALGGFATGLLYADGRPKPSLDAYRLPIWLPHAQGSGGRPLEVWGCVRPAAFLPRPQPVLIEYSAGARGPWRVLRRVEVSDPHGYFDVQVRFPAGGFVRLSWRSTSGHTFFSRLATVTIR